MKIEKLKNTAAPIIMIYGEPGRGKTLLASKFPNPVWMAFERGLPVGVSADAIEGLNTFSSFIRGVTTLRDRHGVSVVLIAHSEIVRFDDPRAPTYSQYQPKLHKRARHLILDACDAVFFLSEDLKVFVDDQGFKERVRATSTNQRFLHSEGCAAFVAKNRYAMPPKVAIPLDLNVGELTKYWTGEKRD
jgi:hypothetical protein